MSNKSALSQAEQRVMATLSQQPDGELRRSILRDRSKLNDSELLAALQRLANQGLVERIGYPDDPWSDRWKLTSLSQSKAKTRAAMLTTPDGSVVLRPTILRGVAWAVLIAGLLCAFLWWIVLAKGWTGGIVLLGILTIVIVVLLIVLLDLVAQILRLTPTDLIIRRWYGLTRAIPRESIARVVLVKVTFGDYRGMNRPTYLLFLDVQGRCLKRMGTNDTSLDELKAFVARLNVPFKDEREPVRTIKELRRAFPHSISWAMQPMWIVLITMGVVLLCIIIVIVILAATGVLVPPQ